MKPAPFQYHRPETVGEATRLLDDLEDAELMAGNQSLGIVMSNRLATPDHVVDINEIDELQYVDVGPEAVEVGAMVRHRDLAESSTLAEQYPLLPESAKQIAGPVVRNRGTVGGSVAEADPAGNYPCVLAAVDGELELASADGRRTVGAEDYFLAYMMTAIEEGELLTGARFPREPFPPERTGMAFLGQKRAPQTWPTLSVAGVVRVDDPGSETPVVEEARLALANAADVPLRVEAAERAVEGAPLDETTLEAAGEVVYDAVEPQDEMHADETYKRELSREYTKRAFRTAHGRATD